MDPILLIVLAVALGFRHSYDADHLVAVSNFLALHTIPPVPRMSNKPFRPARTCA